MGHRVLLTVTLMPFKLKELFSLFHLLDDIKFSDPDTLVTEFAELIQEAKV